ILLFIFSSSVFAGSFSVYGKVFNPGWSTGTAETANSYCGLRVYRIGIPGQVGDQNIGPDSNCDGKIFPAYYTGITTPAYFNSDVGSYDWITILSVGQEIITIVQAYKDQFPLCQWNGNSYVGASKGTVTQSNIDDGSIIMPAVQVQAIPQPMSATVNYYDASLTWTGLSNDPDNIINGYTVYRSTDPVSSYAAITWTANQSAGATVTFNDINLTPNTTYYYKIAVNYVWDGGSNTVNYYTTEATSNTLTITTKNILTSGLTYVITTPSEDITVSTGQFITITARTTNTSGGPLYVTPGALILDGTVGSIIYQSGPTPSAQNVPNGADRYFTWIYKANSEGTASFTGTAMGQNNTNGNIYISNESVSSYITVENAASLTASENAQPPSSASTGQHITVFLTVTNTGTANCNNTTAGISVIGVSGTNTITAISLLSGPGSSVTVPGGNNSHTFTWTYSAAGTGTVYFSCFATGYDENSNNTINAIAAPGSNLVLQTPANLASDIVAPSSVSMNQVFTVLMRVTNTGGATANNVIPSLSLSGGGTVLSLSGPSPSYFTLAGNQTADFTWTYSATGAGIINFS
ncbi:MAG TPA: CARDB domain-containing protein, partial [Candidatus Goldiibacteriota bacterium]|nr:CARDB domain-containing protein [Candidatus Goldiibacteriota bacterium]